MNPVEKLKSEGSYFRAGMAARMLGQTDAYGCHYGMRSERQFAIDQYREGWKAQDAVIKATKKEQA